MDLIEDVGATEPDETQEGVEADRGGEHGEHGGTWVWPTCLGAAPQPPLVSPWCTFTSVYLLNERFPCRRWIIMGTSSVTLTYQ